jgi:hypothetical protein
MSQHMVVAVKAVDAVEIRIDATAALLDSVDDSSAMTCKMSLQARRSVIVRGRVR